MTEWIDETAIEMRDLKFKIKQSVAVCFMFARNVSAFAQSKSEINLQIPRYH